MNSLIKNPVMQSFDGGFDISFWTPVLIADGLDHLKTHVMSF